MDKAARICSEVKERIVPTSRLRRLVETKAEEIRKAVERECQKESLLAEVRLDGSVAKDTWISGYVDADIFMRVSPQLTKKQLKEICLPIAKKALEPNKITERFAEHPYIESTVRLGRNETLRVNVVPCYNVEKGNWLSATDRTPYHTEYIRSHIAPEQKDEVRLLKAFMRGIGAYGADIKTGGFSGMICETLIISRANFRNVLKDFAKWKESQFIDVENYYAARADEIRRIFTEPLVVIDPVDKGRNLGAAVRSAQLWNFVAASRQFFEKPSTSFFAEPFIEPLSKAEFQRSVKGRGAFLVCLCMEGIDAVVDILWSQLFRTQRALANLLEISDFEVIRSASWSDEKNLSVILFEIESGELPASKRHPGPPISKATESSSFLSKHLKGNATVSGPWIEYNRWVVQRRRGFVSARDLLRTTIISGGAKVGVAPLMARAFKKGARVLDGNEIGLLVSRNQEFGKFMRVYLSGRPTWFGQT